MTLQTTAMPLTTAIAAPSASALTGANAAGGADVRSTVTLFCDVLDTIDAEVDRREQSEQDKPALADDAVSHVNPPDSLAMPAFRAAPVVGDPCFALATVRAAAARDAIPAAMNDRDWRAAPDVLGSDILGSGVEPTNQKSRGVGGAFFSDIEDALLRRTGAQAAMTRLIDEAGETAQEALSRDRSIVAGASEEGAAELSEIAPPSPNANPRMTIEAFETHLPIAVAHALSRPDSTPLDLPAIAQSTSGATVSPPEPAALRILTFTLEPEMLGAVTVKMRVMRLSVFIEIDVETAKTQFLLNELKDRLAAAIDSVGLEAEAIDIRVSSAPESSDMRLFHDESGTGHASTSGCRSEDGAFADGGEFSRPHRARAPIAARRLHEQETEAPDHDRDRARGVYL